MAHVFCDWLMKNRRMKLPMNYNIETEKLEIECNEETSRTDCQSSEPQQFLDEHINIKWCSSQCIWQHILFQEPVILSQNEAYQYVGWSGRIVFAVQASIKEQWSLSGTTLGACVFQMCFKATSGWVVLETILVSNVSDWILADS